MDTTNVPAPWQIAWRVGFVPQISTSGLEALARALQNNDRRLIQGQTTCPPPLQCVLDWEPEACCPLGYTGWLGEGISTIGGVEEYFTRLCFRADELLGEPAACRYFLNQVDEWGREELRRQLLPEVEAALAERRGRVA